MKRAGLVLIALGLALGACSKSKTTSVNAIFKGKNGIIGGAEASPQNPVSASTVALVVNNQGKVYSVCTGTLISKNMILTAAHCLQEVEVGDIFISRGPQLPEDFNAGELFKVKSWKTHLGHRLIKGPNDIPISGVNDVALIRLQDEVSGDLKPTPILKRDSALLNGQSLLLAGYGILNEIGEVVHAKALNFVYVPLSKIYGHILVTDQTRAQGACSGDSGGPAYLETNTGLVLVGITRGPHDQAQDCRHFGEYTYASMFESFIMSSTEELEGEFPSFVVLSEEKR